MIPNSIKNASELVTSQAAVRKGFREQALAKTDQAAPYVEEAKRFWNKLQEVSDITTLLRDANFRDDLIAAAGFSEKAKKRLLELDDLETEVKAVLEKLRQDINSQLREEVFYRYLLTKGDALGGRMRNLTGALASQKFTNSLLIFLQAKGLNPEVKQSQKTGKVQRIIWNKRRILFDVKPQLINKNVDVVLLDTSSGVSEKELLIRPSNYLACGELKGGIDPAGADEHWKTARSSLERIRVCFQNSSNKPALFFVAAAIEPSMAEEIFTQLQTNALSYAANTTVQQQVDELANWLVSL